MKKILNIIFVVLFFQISVFAQTKSDTTYLKVMTFNIHHGEGIDGKIDLERIAEIFSKNNIDLVALQEVDEGVERTFRIKELDTLSMLTKMQSYFSKNIEFQGGEYGNGILSRFPILSKTNYHFKMIREGEQRGLLQTIVNLDGDSLLFMTTHLDYRADDAERVSNIDEIVAEVNKYPKMPVIICGDFNDTTMSRTYIKMTKYFSGVWSKIGNNREFTYPTASPEKKIDFIFYLNRKDEIHIEPIKISVLNSNASDHLPVFAEFKVVKKR